MVRELFNIFKIQQEGGFVGARKCRVPLKITRHWVYFRTDLKYVLEGNSDWSNPSLFSYWLFSTFDTLPVSSYLHKDFFSK